MRVLFLAPKYMDLYKNILDELKMQGLDVYFIEDRPLKFNHRFQYKHTIKEKIRNILYCIFSYFTIDWKKYWDDQLKDIKDLYFDKLFVINGFSYNRYLLDTLIKYNRAIETSLYLWDNMYAYDFSYIINDFSQCYTLDFMDSQRVDKLSFLPAFWIQTENSSETMMKYDIFMIGTNHDDRYEIATKVISQMDDNNLKYCIKLVDKNKPEDQIITHKFYPTEEYIKLMRQSRCILDTERPSQTGPTVRLVWALALGKKIISTNSYMKKMPFYNPHQISIVDRANPKLDISFLKEQSIIQKSEYIEGLRIDNWLKIILK